MAEGWSAPARPNLPDIDRQRLSQVWFAGMHSDVGGGYAQDGLSYVALDWMIDRAVAYDLLVKPSERARIGELADKLDKLNDSRHGLGGYYRYKPRKLVDVYGRDPYKPTIKRDIARAATHTLVSLTGAEDNLVVTVAGLATEVQRRLTKAGEFMFTFLLEDMDGTVEVMVFPRTMTEHGHKLADDAVVIVRGRVDTRDDAPKLIAQSIDVVEVAASQIEPLRLRVPPQLLSEANVAHLKRLLADHPGEAPVFLQLGEQRVVRLPERWNVDASNGLVGQLREALGPAAIVT